MTQLFLRRLMLLICLAILVFVTTITVAYALKAKIKTYADPALDHAQKLSDSARPMDSFHWLSATQPARRTHQRTLPHGPYAMVGAQ